jgi:SAM-dependent methyltransferase
MLRELVRRWPAVVGSPEPPDRVLADALSAPFPDRSFGSVAALGNLLGFASEKSDRLMESLVRLVGPGGTFLLEVAPGPGEYSRYLRRLPARSVARLLRSPSRAVALRIVREGFGEEPHRKKAAEAFRRIDPVALETTLASRGFRVSEILAVAPALGPDGERATAVRTDPKAWAHLLEVEEALGRERERWNAAAAVLVAAIAPG